MTGGQIDTFTTSLYLDREHMCADRSVNKETANCFAKHAPKYRKYFHFSLVVVLRACVRMSLVASQSQLYALVSAIRVHCTNDGDGAGVANLRTIHFSACSRLSLCRFGRECLRYICLGFLYASPAVVHKHMFVCVCGMLVYMFVFGCCCVWVLRKTIGKW